LPPRGNMRANMPPCSSALSTAQGVLQPAIQTHNQQLVIAGYWVLSMTAQWGAAWPSRGLVAAPLSANAAITTSSCSPTLQRGHGQQCARPVPGA
jgi:hypothetical protein